MPMTRVESLSLSQAGTLPVYKVSIILLSPFRLLPHLLGHFFHTIQVDPADLQLIEDIEGKSAVELVAIGIGHDVTRYYRKAVTIVDAEQLGGAMTDQLISLFVEEKAHMAHPGHHKAAPRRRARAA